MSLKNRETDFIGEFRISDDVCDKLIQHHTEYPPTMEEGLPITKSKGKVGHNSRVDKAIKDSVDLGISSDIIYKPHLFYEKMNEEIVKTISSYFVELSKCLSLYIQDHGFMEDLNDSVDLFRGLKICEGMNIQHYHPGGGYKTWHTERMLGLLPTMARQLVFMTYLNDVPDGGTEFYFQNKTVEAQKGKTLIWPSDFTHMHRGIISPTHEKYIITGWYSFEPLGTG